MKQAVILFLISALFGSSLFAADITVIITGITVDQGKVRLGMFNNSNEFPNGQQKAGQFVDSENKTVKMIFTDIEPGTYAFAAFQDRNGNEKLDTNFLGMPKEKYGFSGKEVWGNPKFDDAVVLIESDNKVIRIEIK